MLNLSFSGSLNFLASSKNESVLTAIDQLDKTTKTSSVSTFDFSTLNAKTSYKLYIFVLKITKPYILQLPNMVHENLQSCQCITYHINVCRCWQFKISSVCRYSTGV